VSAPARTPLPLPLIDLLHALQEAGLPVSVREHLAVGRLLSRWDVTDTALLRSSLAALLARNAREVQLVRETFDRVYGQAAAAATTPAAADPPLRLGQRFRTRWVAWGAGFCAIAGVLLYFAASARSRPVIPPQPPSSLPSDAPTPPPQLIVSDVLVRRVNWWRTGALTAVVGALLFLVRYRARTARDARRHGLRHWTEELDGRPGPLGYEINTAGLRPAWPPGLLDDLAAILGRHAAPAERGDEIDVDRSVAATLRAGLAPQIVWRVREASLPILVLQDVGEEMRPWRRRVDALLDGLAVRGVALDRWTFDGDGGRVSRGPADPPATLRQLARRAADSPLLVISAGQGVLEGEGFQRAGWVDLLRHWRSRAWLHPVADPRYWRRALRSVPVEMWPMGADGLVAAARQLSRGEWRMGERTEPRAPDERPVAPLDVERLRWLISLAPRRDALLAELLRQKFCPTVPTAALLEALAAPPSTVPPPVGPDAAEVHAFLAEVLAASRPREEDGTAFDRWRVDHALQLLGAGQREQAVGELSGAAERAAPLVADAVDTLGPLTPALRESVRPQLQRSVAAPLEARALRAGWAAAARWGGRAWTRPKAVELLSVVVVAAAFVAVAPGLGPLTKEDVMRANEVYVLSSSEPAAMPGLARTAYVPGPFSLTLRRNPKVPDDESIAPRTARLFQDDSVRGDIAEGGPDVSLAAEDRGHWFQAQARLDDGTLAVSNLVWVAKEATSGWLQVVVLGPAGEDLASVATVEVTDGRRTVTSSSGARLPVPLGDWTIRVQAPRYVPLERQVEITGGSRDQPMREAFYLVPVASPTPAASPSPVPPRIASITPSEIPLGRSTLSIRGRGLHPLAAVAITTPGVVLSRKAWVSPEQIDASVEVYPPAAGGLLVVTVRNPDGTIATARVRVASVPPGVEQRPPPGAEQNPPPEQQGPPPETRQSELAYGDVGCEEERVVQATYRLRPNEEYVDATIEVQKASNLKSQEMIGPVYNATDRIVTGSVRIRGLDRVLLNCPGGGNVAIVLRVRVRAAAAAAS
jgi:hypothetical protein